jgi:hypothetical protein
MKKLLLLAMVLGVLVFLSAPVWAGVELKVNYTIGFPLKVSVGEAMITYISYLDGKPMDSYDLLIYNGKSGDTIKLSCGSASARLSNCRPGTEFTFDLRDGKTISWYKSKIEILKVDNTGIEFVVISDK